jgi:hypothetical protein
LDAFLVFLKKLRHTPRVLLDGDDVISAPENLHFLDFHELVLAVEVGEMKDEEIIIVVDVDFRALVDGFAVFDVQRVEMESVFQEFKVFLGWVVEMTPSQVSDFQAVNHRPFPLSFK